MKANRIGVLGDGITATAVRCVISKLGMQESDPQDAELIVASPGIPPAQYPSVAAPIISEIEWAYRLLQTDTPPKVYAITGTNGKSTTTALLAHILSAPAAGNIGVPLIEFVRTDHPEIVVELSSYQLYGCHQFRPNIAGFLNITPDHLDWHESFENYQVAKFKMLQNQLAPDTVVYCENHVELRKRLDKTAGSVIPVDPQTIASEIRSQFTLPGAHNLENLAVAVKMAQISGQSDRHIAERVSTFSGLPHRLERVSSGLKCDIYNDSKATNPDSAVMALQAFDEPVHLIVGGQDKGVDIQPFIAEICRSTRSVTALGSLGKRVITQLQNAGYPHPISEQPDLKTAVDRTIRISQNGDIILFSPGGASFDQFKNFEDRGDQFKSFVGALG